MSVAQCSFSLFYYKYQRSIEKVEKKQSILVESYKNPPGHNFNTKKGKTCLFGHLTWTAVYEPDIVSWGPPSGGGANLSMGRAGPGCTWIASCKKRENKEQHQLYSSMLLHMSTCVQRPQIPAKEIHFRLSSGIKNEPHIPKATQTPLWLVDALCYPQRSSPSAQRSGLKALIGREKSGMMKEGQQGEAADWWSPVSSRRRGSMSWGRKRQMLKELFVALIERIVELTEYFCFPPLLAASNASFPLSIDSNYVQTQEYAHTHTRTRLFSLDLTCVFIKVSSCSIARRSNGDWLWHNYTNPCMNFVLMEAEHLTQTKCSGADQCWGFFFSLEQQSALSKQDIYICNASPLR